MEDTIAAIATATSPAGISVIRISGPQALETAEAVFVTPSGKKKDFHKAESHTIHYGYIEERGERIDEVLLLLMKAPRSYTAEDTVEIDCHGGILVTRKILETVCRHGARPAEPGEFTKRAFLNGRIDLSQAEAVTDLISAKNQFALKSSVSQLQGTVAETVHRFRNEILDSIAFIEAALDDPEHLSVDGYGEVLEQKLQPMIEELQRLIDSSENGRILTEGIRTVLLGKPNAGKSSILNLLAGSERAIVTDIEGTTRDAIEEQIRIGDFSFQMMDTAGIRNTEDKVERIGVEKARTLAKEADLILYVCDTSVPLDENDEEILPILQGKKVIYLLNKSDLTPVLQKEDLEARGITGPFVEISAANGTGREELEQLLTELFETGEISWNDQVFLTNERQKAEFRNAENSLKMVRESIESGMSEDFFTIDLMNAYTSLGMVVGEAVEEDLVNRIFSKFCMGK